MPSYHSQYSFGDRVTMNEDNSIVGFVQTIRFTSNGNTIEVSWFANGAHYECYFYEWQLKRKET